jgi:hypothetical protein
MKLNTFIILDRAVRDGTAFGLASAMQNDAVNKNPELLIDFVADHIMSELSNIIIFDDMTKEDPITIDPAASKDELTQTNS